MQIRRIIRSQPLWNRTGRFLFLWIHTVLSCREHLSGKFLVQPSQRSHFSNNHQFTCNNSVTLPNSVLDQKDPQIFYSSRTTYFVQNNFLNNSSAEISGNFRDNSATMHSSKFLTEQNQQSRPQIGPYSPQKFTNDRLINSQTIPPDNTAISQTDLASFSLSNFPPLPSALNSSQSHPSPISGKNQDAATTNSHKRQLETADNTITSPFSKLSATSEKKIHINS